MTTFQGNGAGLEGGRREGAFTLIELMVVVAVIGVLAAVASPALMQYLRKARKAEAPLGVKRLYDGARSYYMEESSARGSIAPRQKQFPSTPAASTSPSLGSCCSQSGSKCAPDPALWTDPSWQALKFAMEDPHYYSYTYESAGIDGTSVFSARANGDLDCDGIYSTFELVGSIQADGSVSGQAGFFMDKDLE